MYFVCSQMLFRASTLIKWNNISIALIYFEPVFIVYNFLQPQAGLIACISFVILSFDSFGQYMTTIIILLLVHTICIVVHAISTVYE